MRFKYKYGSPKQKRERDKIYKEAVKETAQSEMIKTLIMNFLAISAEALADEFGFGDVRLNRWKGRVDEKLDCINNDFVDWEDIRGNIKIVNKKEYKNEIKR